MLFFVIVLAWHIAHECFKSAKYHSEGSSSWIRHNKNRSVFDYVCGCLILGLGETLAVMTTSAWYFTEINMLTTVVMITTISFCIAVNKKLVGETFTKRWQKVVNGFSTAFFILAAIIMAYITVQQGA